MSPVERRQYLHHTTGFPSLALCRNSVSSSTRQDECAVRESVAALSNLWHTGDGGGYDSRPKTTRKAETEKGECWHKLERKSIKKVPPSWYDDDTDHGSWAKELNGGELEHSCGFAGQLTQLKKLTIPAMPTAGKRESVNI